MVADAKKEHAGWKELQGEAAALIQNQSRRIDDAAASAIETASKVIRTKAEELKKEVQSFVLSRNLCLAFDKARRSICEGWLSFAHSMMPTAPISSRACIELRAACPIRSPKTCGIFYPAIAEVAAICKFMLLGRVVGSLDNDKAQRAVTLNLNLLLNFASPVRSYPTH